MTDRKSPDDVQQLLKGKNLGDLQYRQFTPPQAAHLILAGNEAKIPEAGLPADGAAPVRELPNARLPEQALTPRNGPVAGLPNARPIDTALAPAPALPRTAIHESPLNFTFERLRRQVIPARANGPLVDLNLAPRQRVVLPSRTEMLKKRALSEVFTTLVHAPGARRHGS